MDRFNTSYTFPSFFDGSAIDGILFYGSVFYENKYHGKYIPLKIMCSNQHFLFGIRTKVLLITYYGKRMFSHINANKAAIATII